MGGSLYVLYGHRVIEAIYERRSIGFLNSIIDGQSLYPSTHYVQQVDVIIWVVGLLIVALAFILNVLRILRRGRHDHRASTWWALSAVVALGVMYLPFLMAHIRNSANPLLFGDDARQWVVPFVVSGYASDYYFTLFPIGYNLLYRAITFAVADPITFSKVLPYPLLMIIIGAVCAAAGRLGGAAAAFSTSALCLSTGIFLTHMVGGIPRAFGFPFLAAAAAALVFGRTLWLAIIVVASAAFYPPAAVVAGLALGLETLVLPARHRSETQHWPLARRIMLIAATGLATVVLLAPGLTAREFGPQVTLSDLAKYPESGVGGRYTEGNRAPFDSFWTEVRRSTRETLTGAGEPLAQVLHNLAKPWEEWLEIALLAGAALGLGIIALRDSAALRLLLLGIAAAAAHAASSLAAPYLYLPPRYVTYPIPILIVVGLPVGAGALPSVMRSLRSQQWSKPIATLGITAFCLLLLGGHGDKMRGLTVDLRHDSRLFGFLENLPPSVLVAGWPWGKENIDSVPYLARRPAFVTFETHQALHRGYLNEMRERMRALIDAMFAVDPAPLICLRERWAVTHLIVDRRHYASSPPTYFKPFDAWTRAALERGRAVGFEVPRQLNVATVFSNGDLAVLDLRRIAAQVSSTGTPRTPDGGLARDGNTAGPPASCRSQTNEGDAQLTNRPEPISERR